MNMFDINVYLTRVLVVVTFALLVTSQEIPPFIDPPPPPPFTLCATSILESNRTVLGSRCINGTINTRTGINEANEVQCDFRRGNSCQTKIESQPGFRRVDRQCKQNQACTNNAHGNIPKCYPGENNVRQCFLCCQTDLCNDVTEIPELE